MKASPFLKIIFSRKGKKDKDAPRTPAEPMVSAEAEAEANAKTPPDQWPTVEEREIYQKSIDDLRYAKTGKLAEVARRVGCERQYVHQVLNAPAPFNEGGYKARLIWETLPQVLKEDPDLDVCRQIIRTLEEGESVELTTDDPALAAYVQRRTARLEMNISMVSSKGEEKGVTVYLFAPEGQLA